MDENVVFDPNKPAPSDQQPSSDPATGAETPADVPSDPAVAESASEVPADAAVDPNAEVVTDAAADETVDPEAEAAPEEPESPPPPLGVGFLGGGMLKKILIGLGVLVLLIILILVFMPKGSPTKQVKLQWWGLWEESTAVQSLIIDFKKTHPNIDVEYVKKDPADYRDRLLSRSQNGSGPDIFRYHNTWMPMLTDVLLPLSSDVITPDDFKKTFYPVMQKDLTKNGAIYGIPMEADSLAMFVNPKLFADAGQQVPDNWDDFVKVSQKLTKRDATGKILTAGASLGTYDNITHASDIISLLFVQQGVDMDKFLSSTKSESDALNFYTSFSTGEQKVWNGTLDNSTLAFSKGNSAIYFGYSWDVFTIQRLNKDLNFKIYPVPQLYGKKTTVASYWVEGVSAKSPNQKEALEFMKYLAQKDTAEKFYTESAKSRPFGEPYARRDLRENLREEPLVYPFLSQLDDAASSFFASDTHDGDTGINSLANTYLGTAIRGMVNDGDSPDSAVEKLNKGIQQVFDKYAIQQQQ
jgi:multiple sugar transport system substrate-binding protein